MFSVYVCNNSDYQHLTDTDLIKAIEICERLEKWFDCDTRILNHIYSDSEFITIANAKKYLKQLKSWYRCGDLLKQDYIDAVRGEWIL